MRGRPGRLMERTWKLVYLPWIERSTDYVVDPWMTVPVMRCEVSGRKSNVDVVPQTQMIWTRVWRIRNPLKSDNLRIAPSLCICCIVWRRHVIFISRRNDLPKLHIRLTRIPRWNSVYPFRSQTYAEDLSIMLPSYQGRWNNIVDWSRTWRRRGSSRTNH